MATNRIKEVQTRLPRRVPFGTSDLAALGVSASLAHEYVNASWLEKLGRGVFKLPGEELRLNGSLLFLQKKLPGLHVAAKTALAWHGFRHNVAAKETTILWGDRRGGLPGWFNERFPVRYSSSRIFDDQLAPGTCVSPLPDMPDGPRVSEPERALLEMLSEVGVHQELEEARNIMEGMRQVRTRKLGTLLARCTMVKTVRLCVSWARELELPWAEQAREAAKGRMGTGRWIGRLKDGRTLILNPE